MRLLEFAILYGLVGVGCSLWLVSRDLASPRSLDLMLTACLWPLYAPFLLAPRSATPVSGGAVVAGEGVLHALRGANGAPLGALLPNEATARLLTEKLAAARARVDEIDAMFGDPDFDEGAAEARRVAFAERDDAFGEATAASRVANIRRLRALREDFASRLAQIEELLGQLRVQAEVLRLSGAAADGTRDLVDELLFRVEGLDAVLDQTSPAE